MATFSTFDGVTLTALAGTVRKFRCQGETLSVFTTCDLAEWEGEPAGYTVWMNNDNWGDASEPYSCAYGREAADALHAEVIAGLSCDWRPVKR